MLQKFKPELGRRQHIFTFTNTAHYLTPHMLYQTSNIRSIDTTEGQSEEKERTKKLTLFLQRFTGVFNSVIVVIEA